MTPTDSKLVPVGVEVIERKEDLKHMLITEIAIKDRELSLKFKKFIFTHHLEKLKDLFSKI